MKAMKTYEVCQVKDGLLVCIMLMIKRKKLITRVLVLPLLLSFTLEHSVPSLDFQIAALEVTMASSAADRPFQCPGSHKLFKEQSF